MKTWKFISIHFDSESATWYALDDRSRMWEGKCNKDFIIEWDIVSHLPKNEEEYDEQLSEN